jgi:hypothetical protein
MLLVFGGLTLLSALAGLVGLQVSATRLAIGIGDRADLICWTGIWSARELMALPGVSRRGDGELRFDPRRLGELPQRRWRRLIDGPSAHGAALAASLAALGEALVAADPGPAPWLVLTPALVQQLLARAWPLALALREP